MLIGSRASLLMPCAWLLTACFPPGEGIEPPLDALYFPVGLAVSPAATRLYAVNSNFDLQYNAGTLQAYDLERIRGLVPRSCSADADCAAAQRCDLEPTEENGGNPSHWCVDRAGRWAGLPCGALQERDPADRLLEPGRCEYVDPTNPQDHGAPLVVDAVGIGAFATDVVFRSRPPAADGGEQPGGRLFVPVRGDATLHWINVDDDGKQERTGFELECGQDNNDGSCDDRHRVGDDPDAENTRDLRMDAEPFGIDATADGEAIVVTHQTDGAASLFVNSWNTGADPAPRLEYVAEGMPQRVIGVAAIPEPQLVAETSVNYQPGFLVTFRNSSEIRLLRYFSDQGSNQATNPARPYLEQSWTVSVRANATGFDSRGIAIDSSRRSACEVACPTEPVEQRRACLIDCAAIPLGVFVANRTPSSLLVGETRPNASETSSDDLPRFTDSIALPSGPSRVVVGKVLGLDGVPVSRVFVVCFDAAMIAIYDPVARRIERWVSTGRGPHAFAVDTYPADAGEDPTRDGYAFGYVGHFTDSYIGVVDLDQRNLRTYGEIVLTVGSPVAPRASK